MKIKPKIHSAILLAFTFLVFSVNTTKAQSVPLCSNYVQIDFDCTTILTVDFYNSASATSPCSSQTFTSTMNGPTFFTCGCGGTLTNMVVTLISVGGNTPSGVGSVDNGTLYSTTDSGNLVGGGTCANTYQMNWAYNGVNIGN